MLGGEVLPWIELWNLKSNHSPKLLHRQEANQTSSLQHIVIWILRDKMSQVIQIQEQQLFTGPISCPAFFKSRIQPEAKRVIPIQSSPHCPVCLPFLPLLVSLDTWSRCLTPAVTNTWRLGPVGSICLPPVPSCPFHTQTYVWIYYQIQNPTIAVCHSRVD